MFIFNKTDAAPYETFSITVQENALPKCDERFGKALIYNRPEVRFHDVGTLTILPKPEKSTNKTEVTISLTVKKLTEHEFNQLLIEVEMLTGKNLWGGLGEKTEGYYLIDTLRDHFEDAPDK